MEEFVTMSYSVPNCDHKFFHFNLINICTYTSRCTGYSCEELSPDDLG